MTQIYYRNLKILDPAFLGHLWEGIYVKTISMNIGIGTYFKKQCSLHKIWCGCQQLSILYMVELPQRANAYKD
jgi:hypothetical protein